MVFFCSDRSTILNANRKHLRQKIYSSADIVHILPKTVMHLTNIVRAPLADHMWYFSSFHPLSFPIYLNKYNEKYNFFKLIIWAKFPKTFYKAWEIYFESISSISGAREFLFSCQFNKSSWHIFKVLHHLKFNCRGKRVNQFCPFYGFVKFCH